MEWPDTGAGHFFHILFAFSSEKFPFRCRNCFHRNIFKMKKKNIHTVNVKLFYVLLSNYVVHVFWGHLHTFVQITFRSIRLCMPGVCVCVFYSYPFFDCLHHIHTVRMNRMESEKEMNSIIWATTTQTQAHWCESNEFVYLFRSTSMNFDYRVRNYSVMA